MKGFTSIRTTSGFSQIYKRGRYAHASSLVLYFVKGEQNLFGVVASKKVGKAVFRNRAKRRLRALFIEHGARLETGSYVVVAKAAIHELSFQLLQEEWFTAIERVGALKKT